VVTGSLAALRESQRADKDMRQKTTLEHIPIPQEWNTLKSATTSVARREPQRDRGKASPRRR
jgi:hypothetical protein